MLGIWLANLAPYVLPRILLTLLHHYFDFYFHQYVWELSELEYFSFLHSPVTNMSIRLLYFHSQRCCALADCYWCRPVLLLFPKIRFTFFTILGKKLNPQI